MSRYVDLDGLTWDGQAITSKIQEVKTRCGYMQGITVGWLWGDNVPHIDLDNHDKQIRDEVIEKFKTDMINKINFEEKFIFVSKSNNEGTNVLFDVLRTFCESLAEQLKRGTE